MRKISAAVEGFHYPSTAAFCFAVKEQSAQAALELVMTYLEGRG
jgi:hypothetical protein